MASKYVRGEVVQAIYKHAFAHHTMMLLHERERERVVKVMASDHKDIEMFYADHITFTLPTMATCKIDLCFCGVDTHFIDTLTGEKQQKFFVSFRMNMNSRIERTPQNGAELSKTLLALNEINNLVTELENRFNHDENGDKIIFIECVLTPKEIQDRAEAMQNEKYVNIIKGACEYARKNLRAYGKQREIARSAFIGVPDGRYTFYEYDGKQRKEYLMKLSSRYGMLSRTM